MRCRRSESALKVVFRFAKPLARWKLQLRLRSIDAMASTSQLPPYLIPALKPPPGLSPDFEHPPTLRRRIIAASVIFPAIAACFVAIRIYTRAFITRALWWDDCTWNGRCCDLIVTYDDHGIPKSSLVSMAIKHS